MPNGNTDDIKSYPMALLAGVIAGALVGAILAWAAMAATAGA